MKNNVATGGDDVDDEHERRRVQNEKIRRVKKQYGFTFGKKPVTLEEIEGRKRNNRDMLVAERERHREQIREYQKLYRRRRRRQVFNEKQNKWTPE